MLELYSSLDADRLRTAEHPTAKTTTATTLGEFARETLLPSITGNHEPDAGKLLRNTANLRFLI